MDDNTNPEDTSSPDKRKSTSKRKEATSLSGPSSQSKYNKVDTQDSGDNSETMGTPISATVPVSEESQPYAPIYLFKRKSQRMREANQEADHYPPIIPELEQSILALEQGLRCDCFIKVREGLIPAHSVLLSNARTIGAAFASAARESITMTFDMSAWPPELVLDIIELLYTTSFEHLKPIHPVRVTLLYEMLVFLDYPQACKFLLRGMVSALITLDDVCKSDRSCKGLDPTIRNHNLGIIQSSRYLSMRCAEVVFRVLWIVMEVKEVPPFDRDLKETFLGLFCRAVFRALPSDQALNITPECLVYFCSLSLSSVMQVVQECARHCLEYKLKAVVAYIRFWMNWDPANRMEGIELLHHVCFEDLAESVIMFYMKEPAFLLVVDGEMKRFVTLAKHYLAEVERRQRLGRADIVVTPMTPFSIYYYTNSQTITVPPLSDLPSPSPQEIMDALDKIQLKVFTFGTKMLMKWLIDIKKIPSNNRPTACCNTEHVCSKFA